MLVTNATKANLEHARALRKIEREGWRNLDHIEDLVPAVRGDCVELRKVELAVFRGRLFVRPEPKP